MKIAGKRDFEPAIMAEFGVCLHESEVKSGGRSVNTINTVSAVISFAHN